MILDLYKFSIDDLTSLLKFLGLIASPSPQHQEDKKLMMPYNESNGDIELRGLFVAIQIDQLD
jgi:hypothetical protein